MSHRGFALLFAGLLMSVTAALAWADELNAYWVGRPEQFRQGVGDAYGVWLDGGIWNLQTTSRDRGKEKRAVFTGSVRVDRDKIIGAFQGLERKKKKANSDFLVVHKDQKGFDFRFATFGKSDGVDFKVGKNARTITFTLLVDGDDNPKRILIGASGARPEKGTFTLPAHVEKE